MDFKTYQATTLTLPKMGFSLEYGRMAMPDEFLQKKASEFESVFAAMDELEGGAIANPDENRMVGHYWLRSPELAPNQSISGLIENTQAKIVSFCNKIHKEKKFSHLLVIGIGGSALGPQFVAQVLGEGEADKLIPVFFDNTDPDGMERTLATLPLKKTLVVVISKSGSTPETRNGMLEAKAAFVRAKVDFAKNAVAITQEGSLLDQTATGEGWLERFPMWDWVGGRTSIMSAVGLLPMALQGLDIAGFLQGAKAMDKATRVKRFRENPAALLASGWHFATGGVGAKAMVVLPYKDRLVLFSKYLQQLVMESLGKAENLKGETVTQGLSVYGNKGSTDQHAYVQQLRDGLNNFFATFIEVQAEREGTSIAVDKQGNTAGDYLQGFCLGTTVALEENFRQSMSIVLRQVDAFSVGALVALFERAVGFYATLVGINAYHQPGVEAGKKAAAAILELKSKVLVALGNHANGSDAETIAGEVEASDKADVVYRLLDRMAANPSYGVGKKLDEDNPFASIYTYENSTSSASN